MACSAFFALYIAFAFSNTVSAQQWGGGGGPGQSWGNNGDGNGNPFSNGNGSGSNNNGGTSSPSVTGAQVLGSTAAYNKYITVLIAHAVMASLVWVIFVPWAALLLRINIKSPIVLKLHGFLQLVSYIIFIVAAILGVWLAQQTPNPTWGDVHPRLGLAILALAFLQPWLGLIHHRIFKRRASAVQAGDTQTKAPGRTGVGRIHLWLGRSLIVLGMVNGGLGIRLTGRSPFQTSSTTKKAAIAYGVLAAAMFALYAFLVVVFEVRRKRASEIIPPPEQRQLDKLPTYDESELSLERGPTRYQ